ncbi:MAG: hypothetical protein IKX24_07690 [Prevotella sp.]|nr:hypothetical protein [Prevotella sp.]
MRKQILTLACLLMATMGVNAQISKVALQHRGEVTLYDTDQIQIAIDNSVDGDTIFLNEGEFPGFTVNKKISVIGKGNSETKVTSNITIAIPNSPTLTTRVLDGLNLWGNIVVSTAINSLVIRKCQFWSISFSGVVDKVLIDRCNITDYVTLSSNVVGMDIVNSKIAYGLRSNAYTPSAVNVVNCIVGNGNYQSVYSASNATFINSIVYNYHSSSYYYGTGCNYVKCAVVNQNNGIYQNCWNVWSTVYNYTKDQLIRDGYLGTDETCIGPDGGTTPYTLVSTAPKITDYTLKVDTGEKKLNVNVKVTPQ